MELELLLELGCCLLETVDFGALIANGVAYKKSKPNRTARRKAKEAGEPPPRRNGWTVTFLILTPIVVVLTLLLILNRARILGR